MGGITLEQAKILDSVKRNPVMFPKLSALPETLEESDVDRIRFYEDIRHLENLGMIGTTKAEVNGKVKSFFYLNGKGLSALKEFKLSLSK